MLLDLIRQKALALVLAAIPVGVLASLAFQWVKKQREWVDGLSPALKNGAVFVIGAVVSALAAFTGVDVACVAGENCLHQLDQPTLETMLRAVLTFSAAKLTHLIVRRK